MIRESMNPILFFHCLLFWFLSLFECTQFMGRKTDKKEEKESHTVCSHQTSLIMVLIISKWCRFENLKLLLLSVPVADNNRVPYSPLSLAVILMDC